MKQRGKHDALKCFNMKIKKCEDKAFDMDQMDSNCDLDGTRESRKEHENAGK